MNTEYNGVNINWEALGAKLAALSDEEQGAFYQGFANEILTYDTQYERDMQMLAIGEKLNAKQKYIIGTIAYEGEDDG